MVFQSAEKLGKIGSLSLGIQNTPGHPVRLYVFLLPGLLF